MANFPSLNIAAAVSFELLLFKEEIFLALMDAKGIRPPGPMGFLSNLLSLSGILLKESWSVCFRLSTCFLNSTIYFQSHLFLLFLNPNALRLSPAQTTFIHKHCIYNGWIVAVKVLDAMRRLKYDIILK